MDILGTIKTELTKYLFESVETDAGGLYSEYKLKQRIYNFKYRRYPTGKVNDLGEYEYWFDEIMPRVNNEVKNLRIDSKYFMFWSKNPIGDFPAVFIANTSLQEFLEETNRAEEFKSATEDFSADGNLLFRKTAKGYEKCDMVNTFLTNTLAKTVDQTAIIERFYLTQTELRQKKGLYKNVDKVIKDCAGDTFSPSPLMVSSESVKTSPLYEIYRRTGEVSEAALFKAQGKEGGDPDKFVLAMIIVSGLSSGGGGHEYVLYAEELKGKMSDHFKEAHRGPYKGRWWREGLYELLFDQQTAYNDITNDIMRAIPWNTSVILRSTDTRTLQNIRHALERGTILNSADLQQVQLQARTVEALSMRNEIIKSMDAIANSYEVVVGVTPASGVPLGTTQMMNENANKTFDFLRAKLAICYRYVYKEDVLPKLVKNLKGKDIIRLTGSSRFIDEFRRLAATAWFNNNLAVVGPHTPEMRDALIEEKIIEMSDKDPMIENSAEIWKEVLPRINVTIVGENYNTSEQDVVLQMLQFETDPIRRAWLTDYIYASRGIPVPPPVSNLPQVNGGGAGVPAGSDDGLPQDQQQMVEDPLAGDAPVPALV